MSNATTYSPEQVYRNRKWFEGKLLVGVNGTTFDPPMAIEAIGAETEIGGCYPPHSQPAEAEFGINVTVWAEKGWMVGMSFSVGQNVQLHIAD